jgi:hypothetical protein
MMSWQKSMDFLEIRPLTETSSCRDEPVHGFVLLTGDQNAPDPGTAGAIGKKDTPKAGFKAIV